jgi:predicted AlkP superfamily pyrophosphatase or phosphodiesterase
LTARRKRANKSISKRKKQRTQDQPPIDEKRNPLKYILLFIFLIVFIALAIIFTIGRKQAGGSLVLITLDTVRADRLHCYGYKDISTPNIDYLADYGVLFENAIAPAPITLPSHVTILTGLYPNIHGVRDNSMRPRLELWS